VNQWFLELRFAGITTIFLHHANKDGGQRGTSGREDNIDISILLDWPKGYVTGDGCKFVAKFKKARLEQKHLHLITDTEFALEVDHEEDYFWTFRNLKAENRKTILEMLDQDMAQKDIAEALGIGAGYVSRVRSQAVKDGHLAPNGKLTQSGFVFIHGA
jgi:putative DNA primase/helicase